MSHLCLCCRVAVAETAPLPPSAQLPPAIDDDDYGSDVPPPAPFSDSSLLPLSDEGETTIPADLPGLVQSSQDFVMEEEEETPACAQVFEQCGGIELGEVDVPFSGPSCCESGLECLVLNPFFSQCRYGG